MEVISHLKLNKKQKFGKKIENAKLLVFDFDGTIVNLNCDWKGLKEELTSLCLNEYKLKIGFSCLNKGLMQIMRKLSPQERKRIYRIIERYELEGVENISPIQPVIDFIKKNNHKAKAILSSNTRKAIIAGLKSLKLKSCFGLIVGRKEVKNQKPHPEGFYRIMDYFKLQPYEAVFIGDGDIDFVLGRKVGVPTFDVREIAML
ncbi:MAG: HAD family hydrolase [Candidatus Omnitrophica bacterium]|nr:HAD family hydrolase [Candidatus Omnitrophota bacterium]